MAQPPASSSADDDADYNEPFDYQEYDKDSELTQFLNKEDLLSLQTGLTHLNIHLAYLQYIESEQLNLLCDKLRLKIGSPTRLQFTRAVIKHKSEVEQRQKETQQHFEPTVAEEKSNSKNIIRSLSPRRHKDKDKPSSSDTEIASSPHDEKRNAHHQLQQDKETQRAHSNPELATSTNGQTGGSSTFVTTLQSPKPAKGYDFLVKCILLGDSGTGKSCLLLRYVDDIFRESCIFTVGIDYRLKTIALDGGVVKIQIWDTAGQEKYRTIISAYYRQCDCALICYDVSNRESFESVNMWIENVQTHSTEHVCMVLVATKIDLMSDDDENKEDADVVSKHEGISLADEYGMKFFEISSKSSHGIDELFAYAANQVMLQKKQHIEQVNKQRIVTQEKVDLIALEQKEKETQDDDGLERVHTDRFVKKKCCNVYI